MATKDAESFYRGNLFWGCLSTAFAVVVPLLAYVMDSVQWANLLPVAWLCGLIAWWCVVRGRGAPTRGIIEILFATALGSALFLLHGAVVRKALLVKREVSPLPAVYAEFQPTYANDPEIRAALGNPHKHEGPIGFYEARYDRADVVWIFKNSTWYILFHGDRQWLSMGDVWDQKWNDEDYVKKHIGKLPKDCSSVPKYGIAKILSEHRALFERIGCRQWDCAPQQYPHGKTSFQEFDHGLILGPLHVAQSVADEGSILTLLYPKNGTFQDGSMWKQSTIQGAPSSCK